MGSIGVLNLAGIPLTPRFLPATIATGIHICIESKMQALELRTTLGQSIISKLASYLTISFCPALIAVPFIPLRRWIVATEEPYFLAITPSESPGLTT